MKVLVLGAGGILGSAFVDVFRSKAVMTAGRRELTEYGAAMVVRRACADVVINCAADTDVEDAERDPTSSRIANEVLPGILGEACKETGAVIVHISSTGCYGLTQTRPYVETDQPKPTTVHHRHKFNGENRVHASDCKALIIRTGWLFGGFAGQKKNFVWNRMVEARSKPRLVSDPFQQGNPTYVGDLAKQVALLLEKNVCGTFNCVSAPSASRLEYVRAIVVASGIASEVVAADAPFQRLAKVSPNEAAENRCLQELGLNNMPPWRDALSRYATSLASSDLWLHPST